MKQFSHFLFVLILLLTGSVSVMGQKHSKPDIRGIWQMCFYVSSNQDMVGELKPSNSFKMLTDNGRFINMTVIPNHGAIIIGEGKYKVNSDSVYTEHVEKSIDLPQLSGADNVLHFSLKDSNELMVLKYFIAKDNNGNEINSWVYETWKKVEMPLRVPQDLVR